MDKRSIVHMDLDSFFVSCERLLDSRLNHKPILVGGTGDRGVVSAASYEVRPFGIRSGMPMKMARQLCPEAIVIRGNAATYTKFSKLVTQVLQDKVPVLEKASIDEFYLDLTGMDKFFGCYKFATELRKSVLNETGLPISFGLSVNKTVAKVATNEAKPNNQICVETGTERGFLAPLSVRKIPMVGEKTFQRFCHLGIKKIQTLQQMPPEMLLATFGKNGKLIWQRAQGIDNRPLTIYHERKSISNERTFGKDTINLRRLKESVRAMAEILAYQLRKGNKVCSCVSVKIRYSDFNTYTKQIKIPYTAADHIIINKAIELFNKLYERRMLVRLVGVRLSGLTSGSYQINLFEDTQKTAQLYAAMDVIRDRYGSRSIMRASTMGARTIGSEVNPFDGEPPIVLAQRSQ